jgi:division protein CdvB (Snf7/Vps24/ESCRT-III family)
MQPRIKTMTAKTRNNDKALATFMTRKAEIDTILARLQALSDEHFNANPNEIHWGHAGDLADMSKNLREITDRVFQEGEYAE